MPLLSRDPNDDERRETLRAALLALDNQYPGQRMPERQRRSWDRLSAELRELDGWVPTRGGTRGRRLFDTWPEYVSASAVQRPTYTCSSTYTVEFLRSTTTWTNNIETGERSSDFETSCRERMDRVFEQQLSSYHQIVPITPTNLVLPLDPRNISIGVTRERVRALRARVAQRRAEQLLLENLTEQQRESWKHNRFFSVDSADGRRTYRIRSGITGNVLVIRDADVPWHKPRRPDGVLRAYCCHLTPNAQCPVEDNVLAQKLWLEAREEDFLAMANLYQD